MSLVTSQIVSLSSNEGHEGEASDRPSRQEVRKATLDRVSSRLKPYLYGLATISHFL